MVKNKESSWSRVRTKEFKEFGNVTNVGKSPIMREKRNLKF